MNTRDPLDTKRDLIALEFAKILLSNQGKTFTTIPNRIKLFLGIEGASISYNYNFGACIEEAYKMADEMIEYSKK